MGKGSPPSRSLSVLTVDLYIKLFVWDDETDSNEFSTIIDNWSKASSFRQRTIDYVRESLSGKSELELSKISTDPIITSFRPVGEAISRSCNGRQTGTFLEELLFFINMCGEEQNLQATHYLPTVEEYVQRRGGSSAVRVCLATIEYTYGITLSEQILDDEAMQQIWHESNTIISTTNDILSVKKEIAHSQTDSLVPLLSLRLGSVQAAITHAVDIVQSSILRFEAAERQILERYSPTPKVQDDIRKFIDGCKYACTANLNWR
ncbi:isoprenoid synthase domain-containing protein [Hypoxylon crocopeplum]|nr:isoprenoid synthase domain-containing protein [Hypoxylon crocopeplum]